MSITLKRFEGKVAIVTGASKGIGAAIAKRLAAEGASVVVNYASSREGADRVVAEIVAGGGKAVAVQANVSKREEIERLFAETLAAFDRVDVLVNNAGVYEWLPLEAITEEHFRKQFDLNVLGLIYAVQQAARHFGPSGGTIVNLSSIVSTFAPAGSSVYSASKAAVDAVTRSLSKELGPRGIRINSVNPGLVETEGLSAMEIDEKLVSVKANTPLGRLGVPDDIAPAVAFLASSDSGWMTGETLYITGGLR